MNSNIIRIAIVGLGGVGGYLAAMLAKCYQNDPQIEIYAIARGATLERINKHGLTLESTKGNFTVKLDGVASDPSKLPAMDYIFYCTKSYDIKNAGKPLAGFMNEKSVIIPMMNGVEGTEELRTLYPKHVVMDGCVYVVAFIKEPGIIKETGALDRYCFGSSQLEPEQMKELETILCKSSIEAIYEPEIVRVVWEKFSYISPIATITTYTRLTCGAVAQSEEAMSMLNSLFNEFEAIAKKRGINMNEGIMSKNLHIMKKYPYDTTTSMQRDFMAGRTCELESLTGYIVREGERLGVKTPTYSIIYNSLKEEIQRREV
ncbi:MAG: ketopantoate reductase family protein [Bacteroidales bacterium]